ncbi:hypothetical protein N431DRAFT_429180 [Stipitochalara longipes BDJ]|nr:hypothetical protein N431DRAFT_429180 [Stipitochalara longipes BDJ]
MPISKDFISSPLEAGPSLLDIKQLPPQLLSALDYVSKRLARKRLHISLIVVRKDINIPGIPLAAEPQTPSVTTSPAKALFNSASSTFSRTINKSSQSPTSDSGSSTSGTSRVSLRMTWSPNSSQSTHSIPSPTTPSSQSSTSSLSSPISPAPPIVNQYGLSLIHMNTLTEKVEKILRQTIAKAEKKFPIGSGWLSPLPLTNTITCPATNDLIRRSLAQNEVLFSAEGLTLLSLDHVYTFKCHLHTYSRTLSPVDLTSAVDELRRLVLAQNGRRITKGYLMRAYDWLGVSLAALVDVNEGYKTAYGGQARNGGIEVVNEERTSPPPLKTNFGMKEIRRMKISVGFGDQSPATETDSSSSSGNSSEGDEEGSALVEVGESAKGKDASVDGMRPDRGPHRRGPTTPNGFEDITPVTKGEWCFLMVGDGWKQAKTAPVITC